MQAISRILASRATMRRVEGGAGSKRILLGCDPGARQSAHRIHATHAHLHGRIPASGAPAPRFGAPPILAATPNNIRTNTLRIVGLARVLAHGIVESPLLRMTKQRAFLRALSQNRASASRVSLC